MYYIYSTLCNSYCTSTVNYSHRMLENEYLWFSYCHNVCIMPPAQKQSTLKNECKALGTLDGSGGNRICINGKYYVPWTFPTLPDSDSSTLGVCRPCNTNNVNENDSFPVSNIEYDTTHIDTIPDGNILDNDIFPESDVESMTSETTTDSNMEYSNEQN